MAAYNIDTHLCPRFGWRKHPCDWVCKFKRFYVRTHISPIHPIAWSLAAYLQQFSSAMRLAFLPALKCNRSVSVPLSVQKFLKYMQATIHPYRNFLFVHRLVHQLSKQISTNLCVLAVM